MKRKGHRTIPDFSQKRPASSNPQSQQQPVKAAPPPQPVKAVKPAGSSKMGRRGA